MQRFLVGDFTGRFFLFAQKMLQTHDTIMDQQPIQPLLAAFNGIGLWRKRIDPNIVTTIIQKRAQLGHQPLYPRLTLLDDKERILRRYPPPLHTAIDPI